MLTKIQLFQLAKKNQISEYVILREYLQLLFLNKLYSHRQSGKIFFKGGTCLHLIYQAPRFSEDLDFTVNLSQENFKKIIKEVFKSLNSENGLVFKEKKSLFGKTFLLIYKNSLIDSDVFIKLDFSFREKVLDPKTEIIKTSFPILFTNYINCLSKEEILAEKIRAVLMRKKGRDYYDLWYLFSQNTQLNYNFVEKKLKPYNLSLKNQEDKLKERILNFKQKDFILDLRPFVPISQRKKLGDFFKYSKHLISTSFSAIMTTDAKTKGNPRKKTS